MVETGNVKTSGVHTHDGEARSVTSHKSTAGNVTAGDVASGNTTSSAPGTGATGRTIGDRYTLEASVGSGGMGTVWRAHDKLLRRKVAVKEVLISPGLPAYERELLCERTLREARAAAALNHSSVVRVYDVVQDNERPWIVMELLEARSIAEIVKEDGPVAHRRVVEIGLAMLGALEAAHRVGVLHRDVKPGNVLLCSDGRVVLTDFGVARSPNETPLTSTGLLLGSPQYIAPERARGRPFGPPSDLFSLGATLYAAVEGRPPFDRGDPLPTMTAVVCEPADPMTLAGPLAPVLDGLIIKDPEDRWDINKTRAALRALLNSGNATQPTKQASTTRSQVARNAKKSAQRGAITSPSQGDQSDGDRHSGRHRAPVEHRTINGIASALRRPIASAAVSAAEATAAMRSIRHRHKPRPDTSDSTNSLEHPSLNSGEPTSPARPPTASIHQDSVASSAVPPRSGARRTAYLPAPRVPMVHSQASPRPPISDDFRTHSRHVTAENPVRQVRLNGATRHVRPWWTRTAILVAGAVIVIVLVGLGVYLLSSASNDPGTGPHASSDSHATDKLVRYSDPSGYSLRVPRSWKKVVVSADWVEFQAPSNDTSVRVHQTHDLAGGTTAHTMANASEGYQKHLNNGYTKISMSDTLIDKYHAVTWDWTYNKDGQERHVQTVIIVAGGTSYEISLSSPQAHFSEYAPLVKPVSNSFQRKS